MIRRSVGWEFPRSIILYNCGSEDCVMFGQNVALPFERVVGLGATRRI